jgi:Zn-dependent protease
LFLKKKRFIILLKFMDALFFFIIIILSAVIHEYAHGWMAYYLGDPTAKYAGRLTLNPLAHIDWWGTIVMPALLFWASGGSFIFAYAKPVPYNPYNLRNQKYGPALVGLAGPLANLMIAVIFGLLLRFLPLSSLALLLAIIVYANILLAVFNLVPIPPLDGSKILFAFLPASLENVQIFLERYGIFILLFFVFFAFQLIVPIISALFRLITGQMLF